MSLELRSLEILKGSLKTNYISILVDVMFFAYQVNLALVAFSDFTSMRKFFGDSKYLYLSVLSV